MTTLSAEKYNLDIRKHLSGFETLDEAKRWDAHILVRLCRKTEYTPKTIGRCPERESRKQPRLDLAQRLEKNLSRKNATSSASRVYMRKFRIWYVNAVATILLPQRKVWKATCVPSDASFQITPGKLHSFDMEKATERVSKRIERALKEAGLSHIRIIGGMDISLNEETPSSGDRWPSYWQIHWCLIVQGCGQKKLKLALAKAFPATDRVPRPVRIQQIKDTPADMARAISYSFKSVFFRRVSYRSPRSAARPEQLCFQTRVCPLKTQQRIELALFLDRFPVTQRLLLRNVRRHGTRLVRL
jgi:hypothetical protein